MTINLVFQKYLSRTFELVPKFAYFWILCAHTCDCLCSTPGEVSYNADTVGKIL